MERDGRFQWFARPSPALGKRLVASGRHRPRCRPSRRGWHVAGPKLTPPSDGDCPSTRVLSVASARSVPTLPP